MTDEVGTDEAGVALPSMRVDGQVALVTGAGRGIGAGCARALAAAGPDVEGSIRDTVLTVRRIERWAHGSRTRLDLSRGCAVAIPVPSAGIGLRFGHRVRP